MSKIFDSVIIYGSGTTNSSTLETLNGNKINTFTIKDNGNVGIGTSSPSSKLDIDLGGTSGSDIAIQTKGSIPFVTGSRTTFSVNNNGRLTAGDVGTPSSTLGHTLAAPHGSTNAFNVQSGGLYQGLFFVNTDGSFSLGNPVIGGGYFESNGTNTFRFYGANSGQSQKIGINGGVPTATLHIQGSGSTNYSLKVDNSVSSPLLYVKNDGNVGLGTTNPTHLLDLKHTPPSSAWTSFNSIRIMTDTNITPVQLVTNSKGGASLSLGATNSDSNNGGGISLNGTNPSIFLNGNGSSYYTSMVLKSGAYGLGAGFGETYFTNYGGFGIETYANFGVKTSATGKNTDGKYALNIDNYQYVGIGTAQAGGVSSYGRLTVQGISTDANTFKVSRPTNGLGTVSASQGIGSYSAYTRFDGIGTTFTRCLNVGESIISSGFTLAVQQIVSDSVLYTTLNTGATFTNQSYTLQGLTSINTTNLGRVGIRTDTPNANLHVHPIGTAYEAANLLIPQDLFVVGQSIGSFLIKASIPSYNNSSLSFATYGGNIDFKLSSLANNNFNVKHTVSLNEFNVIKSDIYTNFYHGGTGPSNGIIDQSYFGGVTIATRKTTRTIISNNTGGNLPDTYEGLRIYKGSWVNTSGTTYYPLIALDGNVGLGTSTPTASLHLINTTTGHTFIAQDSNPDSTPFVIDNDGNVGIGTATPTQKLDVKGNGLFSGGVTTLLNIKSGGGGSEGKVLLENSDNNNSIDINCNSNYTWIEMKSANGGNFSIKDGSNNYKLRLGVDSNGEFLRFKDNFFISNEDNSKPYGVITTLGNFGIGTSTPSEKLDVSGKTKTTTLQVTSNPNDGYVLTSDGSGNATWQQPQDSTSLGTGLTVHFSGKTIFNLPSSPVSGNISGDTTNAKLGMIQKIYHQSSVEPTFPTTWKLVGEGVYFTNELNIIYAEYVEPTWIEYWIIQQQ